MKRLGLDPNLPSPIDFEKWIHTGDLPVDQVLESFGNVAGHQLAEDILSRKKENEFSQRLLNQVENVPDWVDFDAIERAQRLYWKHMPAIQILLLHGALAGGYSAPRLNEVLVRTGYLSDPAKSYRRLMETATMTNEIMQPNGLRKGAPGWKSIIHVRFLHAHVRYRQQQVDKLKGVDRGYVPINQADMLATIMAFQAATIAGLPIFGVCWNAQRREDYTHLWRYVAYLIGVQDETNVLAQGFPDSFAAFREYVIKCMF